MMITFYCKKVRMLVLLLHRQHQKVQIVLGSLQLSGVFSVTFCITECKSVVEGVEQLLKRSDALDLRSFLQKRKQNNENMVIKHAKVQLIRITQTSMYRIKRNKSFWPIILAISSTRSTQSSGN